MARNSKKNDGNQNLRKLVQNYRNMAYRVAKAIVRNGLDIEMNPRLSEFYDEYKQQEDKERFEQSKNVIREKRARQIAENVSLTEMTQNQKRLMRQFNFV